MCERKTARNRPATCTSFAAIGLLALAALSAPAWAQAQALPDAPSPTPATSDSARRAHGAAVSQTYFDLAPARSFAASADPATRTPDVAADHRSTEPDTADRYHWRGFIWQNIEFNVAENGFRLGWDPVMRDDIAHKPFWHDYRASINQFNMRRWNDGDTFIVNYVGHSMHGAVAADIAIQNSPRFSRLEWGDPGYAKSRMIGILWATAFSTASEISPAGEAGVGNEGGFTYGVSCQYHCNASNFKPGDHYTNNTGWVDFVVTPTAGAIWVITEDLLDKYVNGPLVAAHPGKFWPKAVRSGLNPSRSFANWLRWQPSWYRDRDHPIDTPDRVSWFPSDEVEAWRKLPDLQIAPFFSNFSIATNSASCFNCRTFNSGAGIELTKHMRGWLSFDSAVSYHPGASPLPSDRAGGNMLFAVFGLSATRQWQYNAVHFAIRPGLVHFDRAYLTSPRPVTVTTYPQGIATHGGDADSVPGPGVVDANGTPDQPQLGGITHFAWDFTLSTDWRLTPHLGFRFGLDDAIVRYRTDKVDAPGLGTPPYLSWLSKQNFINRSNVTLQAGPVFSF